MTNRILLLSVAFCLITGVRAECDSPLDTLAQNYTQVDGLNISFDAMITSQLTPYSIQDYAKRNIVVEPNWQTHVFFCADKVGFDLEASRLGKNKDFYSFSYDGTTYSKFDGPSNMILVSKTNSKAPPTVWNRNPLVLPTAMLAKSQNVHNQIDTSWSDVTKPSFWATGLSAVSVLSPGSLSGIINGNKIAVTLPDKNSSLGILGMSGFESFQGDTSKPWMKYECSEVGSTTFTINGQSRNFFYPKKATLQTFDIDGNLLKTEEFEITKISLNDPAFDESKFAPDPALATRIYDLDSGKVIRIPK